MLFVAVYGLVGFLSEDSPATRAVLGGWSDAWSLSLLGCGALALVGLGLPAPNGLVANLVAMAALATATAALLVATAVYMGAFFYPGSISLYVFALGALWRSGQLLGQLTRLLDGVSRLAGDAGGERR